MMIYEFASSFLLAMTEEKTRQQVEKAMEGHILAKTQLMGRYKRLS